jgi:hypothetical protein
MKANIASKTQTRSQWFIVALAMVLLVAMMIPGLAWADHSSDDPVSQYDTATELSTVAFRGWLTEQFVDGKLERIPPGR